MKRHHATSIPSPLLLFPLAPIRLMRCAVCTLLLVLLLVFCGPAVGHRTGRAVREDASRFNLFVTALSACNPSKPWHVACILEQVSSMNRKLHTVRLHAARTFVGRNLLTRRALTCRGNPAGQTRSGRAARLPRFQGTFSTSSRGSERIAAKRGACRSATSPDSFTKIERADQDALRQPSFVKDTPCSRYTVQHNVDGMADELFMSTIAARCEIGKSVHCSNSDRSLGRSVDRSVVR